MRNNGISVIIIFHKRHKHLANTIQGINAGSILPDEVVVVEIDNKKSELPESEAPLKHVLITDFQAEALPVAKARNLGAETAKYETLVFLDVDCIPSLAYIAAIQNTKNRGGKLFMGNPQYLTREINNIRLDSLTDNSVHHPHRPVVTENIPTNDYGLFWSLTFFMEYSTFLKIGGFDIQYKGYGAEDTDFAFKARQLQIPFILTDYKVYHQQHSFCRPPLNHFEAIVNNSNYFYSKWKHWPMENHLGKFKDMGLINWGENTKYITVIDKPKSKDILASKVIQEPYS